MTADQPARVSARGPKALTFAGIAVVVLALVAGVVTAVLFLRVLPTGVLSAGGDDGPDVLASVELPGAVDVDLGAGEAATLLLARPSGEDTTLGRAALDGPIEVTGPDGDDVRVGPAEVSLTSARDGVRAQSVAGFRAEAAGTYTVSAPEVADGSPARLLVVEGPAFGAFFAGIAGTVGGVLLTLGLGAIGIGMAVGGGIWWGVRRDAGRRGPAAGPTTGPASGPAPVEGHARP